MAAGKWVLNRIVGILPKLRLHREIIGSKSQYRVALTSGEYIYKNNVDTNNLTLCGNSVLFTKSPQPNSKCQQNDFVNVNSSHSKTGPISTIAKRCFSMSSRKLQDDDHNPNRRRLKLMDFQELIWPNPMKTLRNMFFSFLIKGYFDETHRRDTFLDGAEQAVGAVSNFISRGEFDRLEGLVTREAIREIRMNYQFLTAKQKKFIAVDPKDLFFRFIYEIGMIFDDETNQRFVEITAVFQGIHGFHDVRERNPEGFADEMGHAQEQTFVCNYRFIREYTRGTSDDWTINKLNHFSPKEVVSNSDLFRR